MKKYSFLLIPLLLLGGCNKQDTSSSKIDSSSSSEISTSVTSNTSITSQTTSSSSSRSSSSSSSSSSTSESGDDYLKGRPLLPNGYAQIDAPVNTPVTLKTSTSSQDWYSVDWTYDQPSDWRYIYKNAVDNGPKGHKTSPNFYSYNPSKEDKYPG